jgi:aminoglycoside phosphotransferase (APT) family kinase protein
MADRQDMLSGTEAPPEHLALDAQRLGAFLAPRVEGLDQDFRVEKFKGGQSNPTYKLVGRNKSYVLRRRPPGTLLASAHAIDREYRVTSALASIGFPVPRPALYCEDESIIGSAFYITEFVEGRVFWNADLPGVDKADRAAIYDSMSGFLASLHQLDYRALGLETFGREKGFTERNLKRWCTIYEQSKLADLPDIDWLMKALHDRLPKEEPTAILHGDFGLYNAMIHPTEPRIQSVLDWEMSTLGNPYIDLAHNTRAWWEPTGFVEGSATTLVGHDLKELGIPDLESYLESYCRRSGITSIPQLNFYFSFVQFRYAVMIQGILKRASEGTTVNRRVQHTQDRVAAIAALARRTLSASE